MIIILSSSLQYLIVCDTSPDVTGELDHLLADLLTHEHQALHRHLLLPNHHEALLAFGSAGVESAADVDSFIIETDSEVTNVGDDDAGLVTRLVHLLNSIPEMFHDEKDELINHKSHTFQLIHQVHHLCHQLHHPCQPQPCELPSC